MNETLYIIGNGFDLHHKIPSSYAHFGRYLNSIDPSTFREIERYFDVDDQFWFEFEERLAYFDVDTLVDSASDFLASYGDDEWKDAYHHDYQHELTRVVQAISVTMRTHFSNWIRQLPIPQIDVSSPDRLNLDSTALFLSFNYTPTLQQCYCLTEDQILHIHGKAGSPTEELILGHGWRRTESDSQNFGVDPEVLDTRVLQGNAIVDNYFSETFKPTQEIIEQQQPFFQKLRNIKNILILGHSLSVVDAPYFHEIMNVVDTKSVRWIVTYYQDAEEAQNAAFELGIDASLATFVPLADI